MFTIFAPYMVVIFKLAIFTVLFMFQWRETQVSIIVKIRIANSHENGNPNCVKLLPAKISVSRVNIM